MTRRELTTIARAIGRLLRQQLERRDARIAELERQLADLRKQLES